MLNNDAKINDIIAVLQDIQGINQKAELKSVLVEKGINALDTDDMPTLISKLSSLELGKKWASGTIEKNSVLYYTYDNYRYSYYTNTNLDFSPTILIFKFDVAGGNYSKRATTAYRKNYGSGAQPVFYNCNGNTVNVNVSNVNAISANGKTYFRNDGFSAIMSTDNGYYPITSDVDWIAFE